MKMKTYNVERITYNFFRTAAALLSAITLLASCATQKQLAKVARAIVLNDSALQHAHIGIAVFDPEKNSYLYQYNSEKYFVPASNTKIVSCYTALKFLGDSLPGIRYAINSQGVFLQGTGDPTFLHPDFTQHPVFDFLKKQDKPLLLDQTNWKAQPLGSGWSWDDYSYDYMPERSVLPVYGNVVRWYQEVSKNETGDSSLPDESISIYSVPEVNWKVRFNPDDKNKSFNVERSRDANIFRITQGKERKAMAEVPFVTNGAASAVELLRDTLGKEITILEDPSPAGLQYSIIRSQPLKAMLHPMMHRSDNFYAEQILMMTSQQLYGSMNEDLAIDTALNSILKDLPQKPRWVDGSGLSRYNLFTPQDFIVLLGKLRADFGMETVRSVFSTGGDGTLGNYFKQDSGYIYAKTGTLSGVVCLSGYLYTRKGKWLQFSVLVNNHRGSAAAIRRRTEQFLHAIREKY